MGIAERREREREQRRNDIIDGAEKVFFAHGFDSATMDDVAEAVELSKATLYLYFDNKQDLIHALVLRAKRELLKRYREAVSRQDTGLCQLEAIGRECVQFYVEHPDYFHLLGETSGEAAGSVSDTQAKEGDEIRKGLMEVTTGAIQTGLDDGTITAPIPPQVLAIILWGQTVGMVQLLAHIGPQMKDHYGVSREQAMEAHFDFIHRALARPEEKPKHKRKSKTMRKLMWAAAALTLFPISASAVTLSSFLGNVRANHPFFAKEQIAQEIAESTRRRTLGAEDWVFTGTPSFTHSEPLATGPFTPERVDILDLNGEVGRSYWSNGGRLSLGWQTEVTDQKLPDLFFPGPGGVTSISLGPSTFYANTLRATYTLPLLRNRGGYLDRLEYELAAFDVDISRVAAEENQENFLLESGVTFLEWVLVHEQRAIAQDRLLLAEDELERTQRKLRSNLVDKVDVLRAEDAVQSARNGLLLLDSHWQAIRAELQTIAGDDWSSQRPEFDLFDLPTADDVESLVAEVTESSRLVELLDAQQHRLTVSSEGVSEAGRASFDLFLSGALKGGDDDLGGSLEMTEPDVTVGAQIVYPFGRRTTTADLETARLRSRQIDLARADAKRSLEAGARRVLVQLTQLDDVISANLNQIETARTKTAEELRLYNRGRGDLTFVIQSRDNEAALRATYAQNAALYQTLWLQYRALADQLLTSP